MLHRFNLFVWPSYANGLQIISQIGGSLLHVGIACLHVERHFGGGRTRRVGRGRRLFQLPRRRVELAAHQIARRALDAMSGPPDLLIGLLLRILERSKARL